MSLKGSIFVLLASLASLIVIALSAPAKPIHSLPAAWIRWVKPDPDHPLDIGCENVQIQLEVEVIDNEAPVQYVQFSRWDSVQQESVVIGVDDAPPYQSEIDSQSLDSGWSQIFAEAFDEMGYSLAGSWIWIYIGGCTDKAFLPIIE